MKKKFLIDMEIGRNEIGEINMIDGIKIINICDWMGNDNDAVYYAARREDFFIRDGFDLAKKEGKTTVIIEYLT